MPRTGVIVIFSRQINTAGGGTSNIEKRVGLRAPVDSKWRDGGCDRIRRRRGREISLVGERGFFFH
ncbi:hypothetical protein C1H46_013911 [Malus baccata]|uniref:Uncharacterized protein n=1 Tax=Malus baccata TaxID=106549 RepID=A0A540MNZ4_MALBA|nr:hypothetical protein C1H46_013911 [Malus baccata]